MPARGAHAATALAVIPRSWLFVPGDSERKQSRALTSAADAVIFDLEDSVAPERRAAARERVAARLRAPRGEGRELWVRVNGVASGELLADLAAVISGAPDGIVVPKVAGAEELLEVHHYLLALEQRERLTEGATRVLLIATETARGVLGVERLVGTGAVPASPGPAARRLAGLTWGAEDLGAEIGALESRTAEGLLTPVFELARTLCLLAAAAAGVPAIDTVHVDFQDEEALARELGRARRDGFAGKLAIHPDQIEPINAAFAPTEAELDAARRIVAAFAASSELGVTRMDGRMLDRPHLIRAQRLLARGAALSRRRGESD